MRKSLLFLMFISSLCFKAQTDADSLTKAIEQTPASKDDDSLKNEGFARSLNDTPVKYETGKKNKKNKVL